MLNLNILSANVSYVYFYITLLIVESKNNKRNKNFSGFDKNLWFEIVEHKNTDSTNVKAKNDT